MDPRLFKQLRQIERTHWWFRGRRTVLLAALERLEVEATTVLDCGCGAGSNLDVLATRFPEARIVGIDIEKDPLEFCQQERSMPVNQADAAQLPFRADAFDLVAAMDNIEHVENDGQALAEFYRVCQPGGTLFITVPAFQSLWGNVDEVGHHFRRYRRAQLIERVRAAGFEVRFVRYFNTLLFPPIAAVRWLARLRTPKESEELRSDFDLVKQGPVNDGLARLFGFEAKMLDWSFPFGVSLMLVAQRPKA